MPKHFLNCQNRGKIENCKKPESAGISWKVAFSYSKWKDTAVFQDTDSKICTSIHRQVFCHIHSTFLENSEKIAYEFIIIIISRNVQNLQKLKIQDSSLIAPQSASFDRNQLVLS